MKGLKSVSEWDTKMPVSLVAVSLLLLYGLIHFKMFDAQVVYLQFLINVPFFFTFILFNVFKNV